MYQLLVFRVQFSLGSVQKPQLLLEDQHVFTQVGQFSCNGDQMGQLALLVVAAPTADGPFIHSIVHHTIYEVTLYQQVEE